MVGSERGAHKRRKGEFGGESSLVVNTTLVV
jgi:hypothetical protein